METGMRAVLLAVAFAVVVFLEWYARNGKGLTANGKKLVRIVAAFVGVIICLVALFEQGPQ